MCNTEPTSSLSTYADILTVVIGLLALVCTVFSTWYMYWRPGRLFAGRISAFTAGVWIEGERKINVIGVPLRLLNIGARPLILERLQLRLVSEPGSPLFKLDRTEKDMLDPRTDRSSLPLPVAVNPNESKNFDCIFEYSENPFEYAAKDYCAVVEAQCARDAKWQPLFFLHNAVRRRRRDESLSPEQRIPSIRNQ